MQDIKERVCLDSGSITNNKICFEVPATALRPRLHTEGFHYIVHTGLPTQRASIEDLGNTKIGVHNSSLQQIQPLHKRQGTTTITYTLRGIGT